MSGCRRSLHPNPLAPIRVSFDIRPTLDRLDIPYQIDRMRTVPFHHEIAEIKPMECPDGLLDFLDWSYGGEL